MNSVFLQQLWFLSLSVFQPLLKPPHFCITWSRVYIYTLAMLWCQNQFSYHNWIQLWQHLLKSSHLCHLWFWVSHHKDRNLLQVLYLKLYYKVWNLNPWLEMMSSKLISLENLAENYRWKIFIYSQWYFSMSLFLFQVRFDWWCELSEV